ncbi:MAG: hypothetical protein KDC48_08230 [Planctomycetes bacterium]|nr:hypothetical protein [Planctomycetota bacterium]
MAEELVRGPVAVVGEHQRHGLQPRQLRQALTARPLDQIPLRTRAVLLLAAALAELADAVGDELQLGDLGARHAHALAALQHQQLVGGERFGDAAFDDAAVLADHAVAQIVLGGARRQGEQDRRQSGEFATHVHGAAPRPW